MSPDPQPPAAPAPSPLEALIEKWRGHGVALRRDYRLPTDGAMILAYNNCADELAAALAGMQREPAAPSPAPSPPIVWVALNGQGQIVGAYATKEQAHENSRYVVGVEVRGEPATPPPAPPDDYDGPEPDINNELAPQYRRAKSASPEPEGGLEARLERLRLTAEADALQYFPWRWVWRLVKDVEAEIASLRAQLDESRQNFYSLNALWTETANGQDLVSEESEKENKRLRAQLTAEQQKEDVLSSPMSAGLLLTLKAECEAQHARAEKAEAALTAEQQARQAAEDGRANVSRSYNDALRRLQQTAVAETETLARAEQAERERDEARAVLVKVRAHTSYLPGADMELLKGLLASIERIVDAALAKREPSPAPAAGPEEQGQQP